jgi:hypothetical protein
MTGLDPRLTAAGLGITVVQLVELWAAHCPASTPIPPACPDCGHVYTAQQPLCATAAVVRPLLIKRRNEATKAAFTVLTFNQDQDLFGKKLSTAAAFPQQPAAEPVVEPEPDELFDSRDYRIRAGDRR